MRRLQTALLAALTGLGSVASARGDDRTDQVSDPQSGNREGAWGEHPSSWQRGGAPTSSEHAGSLDGLALDSAAHATGTLPVTRDAEAAEAARWRARIEARLAALTAELEGTDDASTQAHADDALVRRLEQLVEHASRYADVGVAVRSLDTGEPLFSFHADRELNPASNHKLLTAIAAVELLGADYRFATEVRLDGDALVLVGHGDPSLQVEDLASLAQRVSASGIDLSKVRRIVADDSAFSEQRFGPGYSDDGPDYAYLAPSGALSLQFNTVTVAMRPGTRGGSPRVSVQPPCEHVLVENHATTGRRTRAWVTTRAADDHTIVDVGGTVGATTYERRRIMDPARFTASTFARLLAEKTGAKALPVTRGQADPDATLVAQHESEPLPQVLSAALVFSNNFTSEQVLRTLGRHLSGQPGDWDNGRIALERFWTAIGRDASELTFENASGYSERGRLTAEAIVALLALTQREGSAAASLVDILPASGKHGTMRHRLRRARGRVRAKTGTLSGASALSGLVTSRDGRRSLGFSILVNGELPSTSSRRLQDKMVMALVEHLD